MASYVQIGSVDSLGDLHTPKHNVPRSFPSELRAPRVLRRWRPFLRPNGALKIGVFSTAFLLSSLIVYATFFSPHGPSLRLTDWHAPSGFDPNSLELADPSEPLLVDPRLASLLPVPTPVLEEPPSPSSSSSPVSDVLTPEQIRDIVAPTQGFFSRDYSLGLGWNNVSVIFF